VIVTPALSHAPNGRGRGGAGVSLRNLYNISITMNIFKKIFAISIVLGILYFVLGTACAYAQDYILFYGNGCPHCKKVEDFMKANKVTQRLDIVQKEVFFNKTNLKELE
jgi:hypothetical protein